MIRIGENFNKGAGFSPEQAPYLTGSDHFPGSGKMVAIIVVASPK